MEETEKSPISRHKEVCEQIRAYVENPENFAEGSKSMNEIALELGICIGTVSRNLKIMYWKRQFAPNVVLKEKGRQTIVFCKRV